MLSTKHQAPSTRHALFDSPVVVAGTGGSGTRAVQQVLEALGVFMGANNSATRDSQDFYPLLQENIPLLLKHVQHTDYRLEELPSSFVQNMNSQLREVTEHIEAQVPPQLQWGWKNPRSIFILPFLFARYPRMRFLHVVRDGRDMALSSNLNQLQLYYTQMFGRPIAAPPYVSAIEMWNKINTEAKQWAEHALGERYHVLRFEDICAAPASHVQTLARWLRTDRLPTTDMEAVTSAVVPPDSIARWRQLDAPMQQQLTMSGSDGLQAFGYLE